MQREIITKSTDLNGDMVLSGKPELGAAIHWDNSSNVLCNYMKEQRYLDMILSNKAIIPRYVMEPVEYLGLEDVHQICFPMTCFCDIPFSKVTSHMSNYGEYGIGLDKNPMIEKYKIQPIQYMNGKSYLAESFRKAFLAIKNSKIENGRDILSDKLVNYLLDTLVYMKPIWGQVKTSEGNLENYVFQDECEWRYVPLDGFPNDLGSLILPIERTTEKSKEIYSKALANHEECWLKFDWDEVMYIMVPDELARDKTIETVLSLNINTEEKHLLISKIEISRRFSSNM